MELILDDDGSRRTVPVGDEIVVRLPETPTTGYLWRLDLVTDELQLIDDHYEAPAIPRGAPGVHVLTFRAVRDGPAMLKVVKGRSWEDHPAQVFRVDLDVRV
ncbi:MAG: inhibitor of cysteine peptidase [Pseudonocardiales bacterium]|jgi:inhibitor of cysteine peptidase|nr:inhibitor of cysteine peptidase [Pseudonocardiales bacterium]